MKSEAWPAVSFTWDSPVPLYCTRAFRVCLIVLLVKSGACFSTLGHCPAGSGTGGLCGKGESLRWRVTTREGTDGILRKLWKPMRGTEGAHQALVKSHLIRLRISFLCLSVFFFQLVTLVNNDFSLSHPSGRSSLCSGA